MSFSLMCYVWGREVVVRTGAKWSVVPSAAMIRTIGRGDNKQNPLYDIGEII